MIERGAPHLIRSEEQLAAYTKALFKLTAEPRPTKAQYSVPEASPAEVLRFLLQSHGLRQRDIAIDLGGESVVSEVLSGKRKLNTVHIEQLSRRFNVSPAVFFA
jgi:HTH-type transcriptional regulator/antitoxin HigA